MANSEATISCRFSHLLARLYRHRWWLVIIILVFFAWKQSYDSYKKKQIWANENYLPRLNVSFSKYKCYSYQFLWHRIFSFETVSWYLSTLLNEVKFYRNQWILCTSYLSRCRKDSMHGVFIRKKSCKMAREWLAPTLGLFFDILFIFSLLNC